MSPCLLRAQVVAVQHMVSPDGEPVSLTEVLRCCTERLGVGGNPYYETSVNQCWF